MSDVSVIVAVYNKAQYLPDLLASLADQRGPVDFDVWLIDDGSTDGSEALCDEAATDPRFHVVHQDNSGWPGRPRNVGIRHSTGRYLFFADADDWLEPYALHDLVSFANANGCDVTLPLVSVDGHDHRSTDPGQTAAPPLDPRLAFKSLTPHKLFRRDYLARHGLWFTEEKVPLEDGRLVARAYTAGGRVGRFADRVGYHYVGRPGSNISYGPRDPRQQADSVLDIMACARRLPDAAAAADVVRDLYRRKMLRYLATDILLRMDAQTAAAWVDATAEVADRMIPEAEESLLPEWPRLVSRAARRRDPALVRALTGARQSDRVPLAPGPAGWEAMGVPAQDVVMLTATVRLVGGQARVALRCRPKWLRPPDPLLRLGSGREAPLTWNGKRWVADGIMDDSGLQVVLAGIPVPTQSGSGPEA